MSNLPLSQVQADIKAKLLAHAWFAPIAIFIEDEPGTTAADDKNQEALEEAALEAKGMAVKILRPALRIGDEITSAVQFSGFVGIALVENPATNRTATGHNKTAVDFPEAAAAALKPHGYTFPPQDVIDSSGEDDLCTYLLVVSCRRLVDTE